MTCLCLGPKRSGKTHLLKALQDFKNVDFTTYSMPTIGTSIYTIKFPKKTPPPTKTTETKVIPKKKKDPKTCIDIIEIGGSMAPMWNKFFSNVKKIIYVVDTSNLCQISAAGVLLYSILAEPKLQKTKFLLVLTKMDYAYRQMRNEALLMMQMSKLQKEISQSLTIVEVSSITKDGFDKVYEWLEKS
ncbi:ADP-ribosylation factor 1-like 1 [Episyrphus balteatus]|uniref:ADP-ribosylation factor 1-like 1 n=1 Tax=Episyrphus balteatus TaxID=286459 RepID=UPI002485C15E|nr:ADP-ribosylation factor 1-like 1 [Episyrphus balteatus]